MTAREMNHKALNELSMQNQAETQKLLFENAKKNPCHETFNNLGYYLCTEGLMCSNRRFRKADNLGIKYIIKAAKIRTSTVNLCGIATVIDLLNRNNVNSSDDFLSYGNAYLALDKAVKLDYSDELEYNRLRFLYLCDAKNETILDGLRKLVQSYICEDSITFYLYVLCTHSMFEECLSVIKKYRQYVNSADLMILYYLCGEYAMGATYFTEIIDKIRLDETEAAIMCECLIRAGKPNEAKQYADSVTEYESDIKYKGKDNWTARVFDDLTNTTEYRSRLISGYKYIPSYITPCCYFGCPVHKTTDIDII